MQIDPLRLPLADCPVERRADA